MQGKRWLVIAFIIGLAACQWKEPNPYYCPPGRICEQPASPCEEDKDCDSPLICDPDALVCVQCTSQRNDGCIGATPACGDDGRCRACGAHSECTASEACLPDGTCADASKVAYVKPLAQGGSDTTECTREKPCTKVANALGTKRPYVKLVGLSDEGATVAILDQNVTVLAERDAKLVRSTSGMILEVRGTSKVEIFDLEISGASGGGSSGLSIPAGYTGMLTLTRVKLRNNVTYGIDTNGGMVKIVEGTISGNVSGGVSAKNAMVDISQSTISGNAGGGISTQGGSLALSRSTVSANMGGGLSVAMNGTFSIIGNVFFNNGTQTGSVGAIAISTGVSSMNRLEFNSFARNQVQDGAGSAIQCLAGTFTARNNIMSGNGTLTNQEQVGGGCLHAYSIVRPGTVPGGAGNSGMEPLFKDAANGDLHLLAGSPALNAADPSANLSGAAKLDIDGEERKAPADIGADEVP